MGLDSLPFLGGFLFIKFGTFGKREREKTNCLSWVFLNESLFNKGLHLSFVNGGLCSPLLSYSANGVAPKFCFCSCCNGFAKKKLKLERLPQNSSFYMKMECLLFGSAIRGKL